MVWKLDRSCLNTAGSQNHKHSFEYLSICRFVGHPILPTGPPAPTGVLSPGPSGVFTHAVIVGIGSGGGVHNAVQNRISVHPGADPPVPVILGVPDIRSVVPIARNCPW